MSDQYVNLLQRTMGKKITKKLRQHKPILQLHGAKGEVMMQESLAVIEKTERLAEIAFSRLARDYDFAGAF